MAYAAATTIVDAILTPQQREHFAAERELDFSWAVPDVGRFRVGHPVEIELDSEPGHRVPGEVSFVADQATFTPEKIETRSDRLGQVYRAKVRILAEVEETEHVLSRRTSSPRVQNG